MSPDRTTLDALRIDRDRAPRRRPVGPIVVVLVLLAVGGAAAYWWVNRPRPVPVRTVVVQAPSGGASRTLLNASGYVTARREATVSSKVTGKVVEVLVEEGMTVTEGQVLARLDASNVERSLRLAEAQLESARRALGETRASLTQAERELKRLEGLRQQHVATAIEYDRAETEVRTLRARLERQMAEIAVNEREVAVWEQQLDDTIIRAPFSGVVTSKNAQPGEMISPISAGGSFTRTGICTIVDMTSLEIEVDVNESYINRVSPGQPVTATLDSYPGVPFPAKVIAIIPTADRQKATVKVRVGFDRLDPRILPDMSVKVAFQSTDEPAVVEANPTIPRAAVRQRDGRDIVWVVRNGRLERRAVKLGEASGETVTVIAGVNRGDRIVVEGPPDLQDGAGVMEINQ